MSRSQPRERLDPALLLALDAILQARNLTTAARKLGVTPSAMSHKLRQLRGQLGDPLLVRGSAGMVRTPRAEAIALPLQRSLAELERALQAGTAFDPATARRTFVLSTSDYGEAVVMPTVMAHLARVAPGIDLEVVPPSPDLGDRLERGTLDLVIAPGDPRLPAAVRRRPLVTEGFACALRKGHPARRRWSLDTYLALSHVLIVPRGARGSVVDGLLAQHQRERRIALRMPSFASAPGVIAVTDLCLTAPAGLLAAARRTLPLVVLEPPLSVPELTTYVWWHERVDSDPGHRWLRDLVVEVGGRVLGRTSERTNPGPARQRGVG